MKVSFDQFFADQLLLLIEEKQKNGILRYLPKAFGAQSSNISHAVIALAFLFRFFAKKRDLGKGRKKGGGSAPNATYPAKRRLVGRQNTVNIPKTGKKGVRRFVGITAGDRIEE